MPKPTTTAQPAAGPQSSSSPIQPVQFRHSQSQSQPLQLQPQQPRPQQQQQTPILTYTYTSCPNTPTIERLRKQLLRLRQVTATFPPPGHTNTTTTTSNPNSNSNSNQPFLPHPLLPPLLTPEKIEQVLTHKCPNYCDAVRREVVCVGVGFEFPFPEGGTMASTSSSSVRGTGTGTGGNSNTNSTWRLVDMAGVVARIYGGGGGAPRSQSRSREPDISDSRTNTPQNPHHNLLPLLALLILIRQPMLMLPFMNYIGTCTTANARRSSHAFMDIIPLLYPPPGSGSSGENHAGTVNGRFNNALATHPLLHAFSLWRGGAACIAAIDGLRRFARGVLCIAHVVGGGGNPVAAVHRYSGSCVLPLVKAVPLSARGEGMHMHHVEGGGEGGEEDLQHMLRKRRRRGRVYKVKFHEWYSAELGSGPSSSSSAYCALYTIPPPSSSSSSSSS
ncbi:hypothetical protein DFH27DRAFT_579242, partial [Peziza echinospora]